MKRFVLLLEDDMWTRKYWQCSAIDSIDAEDQCIAEFDENVNIIAIYMEV